MSFVPCTLTVQVVSWSVANLMAHVCNNTFSFVMFSVKADVFVCLCRLIIDCMGDSDSGSYRSEDYLV